MTEDQLELLITARESLAAAKYLLKGIFPGFAASRAYYTMFYIAEAFLEGEEMSFSKHSAVISAFGQYFAHQGKVPVEFHRYLSDAHELRLSGDYGGHDAVTVEQALLTIEQADRFMKVAEELIGKIPEDEDA